MSSFIKFSEAETVRVWNSSFKTIHRFLKTKSSNDPVAAGILAENPIAREMGFLNLSAFSPTELHRFMELITELRSNPFEFSDDPFFQQQVARFPEDLDTLIQWANHAI